MSKHNTKDQLAKHKKHEKNIDKSTKKEGKVEAPTEKVTLEQLESNENMEQKTNEVKDNIKDLPLEDATNEPSLTKENEVAALETKIAALEEDVLRQRAETENFKRRTRQEYENSLKYANQNLIEQLLPVLDAFDRALRTQSANDDATKQFLKGFEMTDTLLKQTLENAGLTVIPSVGEKFDPYLHQAVSQDTDASKDEDEILEELQKGYKLKDRVIRASMVKTNKK